MSVRIFLCVNQLQRLLALVIPGTRFSLTRPIDSGVGRSVPSGWDEGPSEQGEWIMDEKRRQPRRHPIYYLQVSDQDSDQPIGRVVDLTQEGMRLVSERPIALHQDYRLKMTVPIDDLTAEQFTFSAESLWNGLDVNPDLHNTGFRIKELPPKGARVIKKVVEELCFQA